MKRFILAALSLIVFVCLVSCSDSEETVSVDDGVSDVSGDILFTEMIAPAEGISVKLEFFASSDGAYKVDKIVVNGGETSEYTIDLAEASGNVSASSDDSHLLYSVDDINFDGYSDFMIQASPSSDENTAYLCFLWNSEESTYSYAFELENPLFDSENKCIYSTVYDSDKEYTSVYEVSGGKLQSINSFSSGEAVSFVSDLSDFEQYMNPEDRDAYLVLVNTENLLDESFIPDDLCDVVNTRNDRAKQQMRETAELALEALYIEMNACGYTDVSVTSAYRSYDRQTSLFNTYINEEMSQNGYSYDEARAVVSTYSAPPGTSEHQTGLCCDMHNLSAADQKFADEEVYTWLTENAWKFGFILRFPEGKTDITNITFEPWHYRYVGRYHAEKITKLGMCLEEYTEYLKLAE